MIDRTVGNYLYLLVAALLLAVSLPAIGNAQGEPPLDAPIAVDAAESTNRQREGSHLTAQQGHFRATGDRLTFHLRDSELAYPCLENLSLERIAKIVSDRREAPEQSVWEVSGTFTEYRGSNYVLITHAVLKNKSRRRAASP